LKTDYNFYLPGAQYCHQLTDLLKQADFVVLCVPLSPQTKHLISAPQLSIMKPSASLINISRGDVVNQDDLVVALQTGQIRAAALDVTSPEPLPRDHPLLTLPNVIITPHIGTATEATRANLLTVAMNNLVAGLNGEPLFHQKH
jgi:phosphoglycerate dehydrogenase-like enzyme